MKVNNIELANLTDEFGHLSYHEQSKKCDEEDREFDDALATGTLDEIFEEGFDKIQVTYQMLLKLAKDNDFDIKEMNARHIEKLKTRHSWKDR